jgi:hypothetical protein
VCTDVEVVAVVTFVAVVTDLVIVGFIVTTVVDKPKLTLSKLVII